MGKSEEEHGKQRIRSGVGNLHLSEEKRTREQHTISVTYYSLSAKIREAFVTVQWKRHCDRNLSEDKRNMDNRVEEAASYLKPTSAIDVVLMRTLRQMNEKLVTRLTEL
ncbi:hypothetical protein DPMN_152737 [Dreissena polymorpha]|uniref:Uncharacterized protein n=1 Tax=Dreissena polymorpha TaxID=45954 RepID=A0A9D4FHU1_DREPO|nr:hypothetical protein DPMN_152737 [Dreissena polymorpha]